MKLQTVIDVQSANGALLGTVRTRAALENMLGMAVWSRNEDRHRWRVMDLNARDSLCGIDEVSCGFAAKKRLCLRLERPVSGNAKQRRGIRRQRAT